MTLPPIPPSDNLYKFTAIGGLILVVLSLFVPWKMNSELRITELNTDLELKKYDIEEKSLDASMAEVENAIQNIYLDYPYLKDLDEFLKTGRIKNKEHKETLSLLMDRDLEKIRKKEEPIASMLKQQRILSAQTINNYEKGMFLSKQVETLKVISLMTLLIGLIMTIIGFWNWYFKFQIYQDRIVRAQAEQWTKTRTAESEKEEIPG